MTGRVLFCLIVLASLARGGDTSPFKNRPQMPSSEDHYGRLFEALQTGDQDQQSDNEMACPGDVTVFGHQSMMNISCGRGNTVVGARSGNALTGNESYNPYVGHGIKGKEGENGVTRIGSPHGTGGLYLGLVYGAAVDPKTARLLYIDGEGKIGTLSPPEVEQAFSV